MSGGWMYLVAVLDWYSRLILRWRLSQTLALGFVHEALDQALAQTTPLLWNSDQGSQFTSAPYLGLLLAAHVQISMDGRCSARDHIFAERPWRTIKYEELYLHEYASPKEAYRSLAGYIEFYNYLCPHAAPNYQTPAQIYVAHRLLRPVLGRAEAPEALPG